MLLQMGSTDGRVGEESDALKDWFLHPVVGHDDDNVGAAAGAYK
jgi:hypothetical protein